MARGFESKSVESQQADRTSFKATDAPVVDPVKAAARRTLQLSLARAEQDLRAAVNPAHRRMLEQAVTALKRQLDAMTTPESR